MGHQINKIKKKNKQSKQQQHKHFRLFTTGDQTQWAAPDRHWWDSLDQQAFCISPGEAGLPCKGCETESDCDFITPDQLTHGKPC